jgi:hypothetical protein
MGEMFESALNNWNQAFRLTHGPLLDEQGVPCPLTWIECAGCGCEAPIKVASQMAMIAMKNKPNLIFWASMPCVSKLTNTLSRETGCQDFLISPPTPAEYIDLKGDKPTWSARCVEAWMSWRSD